MPGPHSMSVTDRPYRTRYHQVLLLIASIMKEREKPKGPLIGLWVVCFLAHRMLLQTSLCLLSRVMTWYICVCYTSERNGRWIANTKVKGRKERRWKGKKQKGSTRNVVGKRKGATKSYLLPGERINLSLGRGLKSHHCVIGLSVISILGRSPFKLLDLFSSKKEPSIGFSQAILRTAALCILYEGDWLGCTIKLVQSMAFFIQTNG